MMSIAINNDVIGLPQAVRAKMIELLKKSGTQKEVADKLRISVPTIQRIIAGSASIDMDIFYRIANMADVDPAQILGGEQLEQRRLDQPARNNTLIDANDADWVDVPEYALHEFDELGKMDPITTVLMRRDWLYTTLGGNAADVWIACATARYDALDIVAGAALFFKDHRPTDRMRDGDIYAFRVNGGVIIAPFSSRPTGAPDDAVLARDLGHDEDQYQVVARVVGQFARPI